MKSLDTHELSSQLEVSIGRNITLLKENEDVSRRMAQALLHNMPEAAPKSDEQDPNAEEASNHLDSLLRMPNSLEAVKLLTRESRGFLGGYLQGVLEFEAIYLDVEDDM